MLGWAMLKSSSNFNYKIITGMLLIFKFLFWAFLGNVVLVCICLDNILRQWHLFMLYDHIVYVSGERLELCMRDQNISPCFLKQVFHFLLFCIMLSMSLAWDVIGHEYDSHAFLDHLKKKITCCTFPKVKVLPPPISGFMTLDAHFSHHVQNDKNIKI